MTRAISAFAVACALASLVGATAFHRAEARPPLPVAPVAQLDRIASWARSVEVEHYARAAAAADRLTEGDAIVVRGLGVYPVPRSRRGR